MRTEVVVDQNPINQPAPIGSQAPPRGEGEYRKPAGRPESRRETIARAFESTREGVEFPAAKARVGHNQPPEPVAAERPAAAKGKPPIDLRKRPAERDEGGRFAPREVVGGAQTGRRDPRSGQLHMPGQQPGQQPGQRPQAAPGAQLPARLTPYREPPPRMSAAAKQAWARDAGSRSRRRAPHAERVRPAITSSPAPTSKRCTASACSTIWRARTVPSLQQALTNYVSMENQAARTIRIAAWTRSCTT